MNEFNVKLATIGERAAWAIKMHCIKTRTKKGEMYKILDINAAAMSMWRRGKSVPDGYHLQQMALNGLDIHWILTGRKQDER